MKLEGIHHVTAITADAPGNVEFYTGVLGLRMVKQTVNQDDPTVYHLFYGDDDGSPGMDLTFFEYPGAARGRPGAGMVHRVVWRVASGDSLQFWNERLQQHGVLAELDGESLLFADPEGLEHELVPASVADAPLRATSPEVPVEYALQGFDGVRAYSADPSASAGLLLDGLGFETSNGTSWGLHCARPCGRYCYDAAPPEAVASQGAGTVHHVAFASTMDDHERWRTRAAEAGAHPTPVIDRFYFRSVYFREPSGVLFEIATIGPGFAVDEDAEHLGERLSLPPRFEPLRERLQGVLKPLPYPRPDAP
jgi:glyoxalase family protein